MIWLAIGIFVSVVFIVMNIRVWRTESLRLSCVKWAVESRAFHGRVYSHPEKTEVILARAYQYEDFIRNGKPKDDRAPPPPPPPPPHRIDRITEGNV